MTKLEVLDIDACNNIDDEQLQKLNLFSLSANNNPKVKKINHMTNLKILEANGSSGIDDEQLQNMNLYSLFAMQNSKITKTDHMTNLINVVIVCSPKSEYYY